MSIWIATGSRGWRNEGLVESFFVALDPAPLLVMHGGCPDGGDALTDRVCRRLGIHVARVDALWRGPDGGFRHGAGKARNSVMARVAGPLDASVVAFWDGVSGGTGDMIARTRSAGRPLTIVFEDGTQTIEAGLF